MDMNYIAISKPNPERLADFRAGRDSALKKSKKREPFFNFFSVHQAKYGDGDLGHAMACAVTSERAEYVNHAVFLSEPDRKALGFPERIGNDEIEYIVSKLTRACGGELYIGGDADFKKRAAAIAQKIARNISIFVD